MRLLARFFGFFGGVFVLKRMSSMQLLNHYLEKTATNNPCLIVSYLEIFPPLGEPGSLYQHPTSHRSGRFEAIILRKPKTGLKQIHWVTPGKGTGDVGDFNGFCLATNEKKKHGGGFTQNMILFCDDFVKIPCWWCFFPAKIFHSSLGFISLELFRSTVNNQDVSRQVYLIFVKWLEYPSDPN